MITRASKILESLNKLKIKSYINEEYPNELKLLNSTQLKKVGDLLSKNNFDVQRTDFGQLESNVSNRDPRLKDPNYIMFVLREYPQPPSPGRKLSPDLFVLQNGKLLYGDEYFFKNNSWTTFVANAKIWFIQKGNEVSTKGIRQERKNQKDGALALEIQKTRKAYESSIEYIKKQIESYKENIKLKGDAGDGWYSSELKRYEKDLKDTFISYDAMGNNINSNLSKLKKKLEDQKKNSAKSEFDDLNSKGQLVEKVETWITSQIQMQMQLLKDNPPFNKSGDKYWSEFDREKARKMSDSTDMVRKILRYMEDWMSSGKLSDETKKEILQTIKS